MGILPHVKNCTKCNKPFANSSEYFCKSKKSKTGLSGVCKPCTRAKSNEYYKRNKPKVIARVAAYQKDHPEQCRAKSRRYYYNNHEKELERNRVFNSKRRLKIREWYYKTIEARKIYSKEYTEKHKSEILQRGRDYYRKYPEKALERYAKRRARKLNAKGSYGKSDIELLYKSQKGLCWWCGKPVGDNYHIDHRIALTKGGTNWPNNLCISCPECNLSKGNKLPHEWNGRLL